MNVKIETKNAPEAVGPYSQGIVCGELVFTSGQIAIDPSSGLLVEGGISQLTHRVCLNIKAILEEAGSSLDDVISVTCYLTDMNDFTQFNKVYGEYFVSKPARSCAEVKGLPKNSLVEISVIAQKR